MDELSVLKNRYMSEVLYGGLSLKYVPKEFLSKEMCMRKLAIIPHEAKFIPKGMFDKDMCKVLINSSLRIELNAWSVCYVPEGYMSYDDWWDIVKVEPSVIKHLPKEYHTKEIFLLSVSVDGRSLEHIPKNRHSNEICKQAIINNPVSLLYVANRFFNYDMSDLAVSEDVEAFKWVSEDYKTMDNYLSYYVRLLEIYSDNGDSLPERYVRSAKGIIRESSDDINDDEQITKYQRDLGLRYNEIKEYNVETSLFRVIEYIGYKEYTHDLYEYDSFHQFYEHLEGDLTGANLYDYDFEGVDISHISLDGAYVNSDTLHRLGVFDDRFYRSLGPNEMSSSKGYACAGEMSRVGMMETIEKSKVLNENIYGTEIHYISDIHLDHKIKGKFPERATREEVIHYIKEIINEMVSDKKGYLVVLGDVSSHIQLVSIFYEELSKVWNANNIMVTLGNHELWGYGIEDESLCHHEIVEMYRALLDRLNITLLENDLVVIKDVKYVYPASYLDTMTDNELFDIFDDNELMFFGGVGYSGCNPRFNASQGIYRDTISTIEKDIELTNRFNTMYERLKGVFPKKKILVLTHMPKQDWSNTTHNENWIYMNGHTHHNNLIRTEDVTVYADNQIGYNNNNIKLKHICIDRSYDIFEDFPDGKHIISRKEYLRFNWYKGNSVRFNSVNGTIHMLKNSGLYMFFYVENKNNRLYLLYGGRKLNIDNQSMEYYYNNMVDYVNRVEYQMGPYYRALKQISNMVKSIGGSGHIHGSIVDIDYYNHIYLNLSDGKVTPYYAESVVDKDIYPDIPTLLKERCPEMLDKYLDVAKENDMLESIKEILTQEYRERVLVQKVYDTSMYKPSNKILGLQYMTNKNIIRVWYDDILKDNSFDSLMLE